MLVLIRMRMVTLLLLQPIFALVADGVESCVSVTVCVCVGVFVCSCVCVCLCVRMLGDAEVC